MHGNAVDGTSKESSQETPSTFFHTFKANIEHIKATGRTNASVQPAEETVRQTTQPAPILLGTISPKTPTVSNMLHSHPDLKNDCWQILALEQNSHKPFTSMQNGTMVYFDRTTQELSWAASPASAPPLVSSVSPLDGLRLKTDYKNTTDAKQPLIRSDPRLVSEYIPTQNKTNRAEETILLGKISAETPTISDLITSDPVYKNHIWQIVHAKLNSDKPFTKIPPGTEVYINKKDLELSWEKPPFIPQSIPFIAKTAKQRPPGFNSYEDVSVSTSLASAVKPYYGRPYEEIDCYDLILRGLREMGVRYMGHGGLRQQLVNMAVDKGLPRNTFFNGEGIIEASGARTYSKSINWVSNARSQASEAYEDLQPLLEKGNILSFSLQSRGHTGIVSQKDGMWTFINSGKMDNPIDSPGALKSVGEEKLKEEVFNWFKLAKEKKESLQITLGRLQVEKLTTAFHQKPKRELQIL